jgi:hypothetical protein
MITNFFSTLSFVAVFGSGIRDPGSRIRNTIHNEASKQCSGCGSISTRYGSGSFYHQAKIVRKTLISTVF